MEENIQQTRVPRVSKKSITFIVIGAAVISGLLYYVFFTPEDPQKVAEAEAQRLVAAVGKLMVLPSDEQPIIATVADPTKLQDQPFFANAKKGDKVLIYNIARKAVLYSEAENRIVDVAPLSPGQSPGSATD